MSFPEHAHYFLRSLDQQKLDALLRIEAILARAFPEEDVAVEGDIEDAIVNIKPTETPFLKAMREDVFDPDGHKVGSVKKKARK